MSDAAIGVVGTAMGALLGALLTYLQTRWTEKRQREREDRTRFHQERRQVYAMFMNRAYQLSVTEEDGTDGTRRRHVRSAGSADPPAYEQFIHAYFEARMLASEPVRDAAQELREAAEERSTDGAPLV